LALIEKNVQHESKGGGRGLTCTSEGVCLAGVPLLHRTSAGLAPRPMDELTALMKSAYGQAIDPARSYPGLDVIAQALNRGDIGRAMVAAIHLRLPELSAEGAARIGFTDDALNKYDSSEPRDERGRWTSGGGSSPNAPAKPAKRERLAGPAKPGRPSGHTGHPRDFADAGLKPTLVAGMDGPLGPPTLESMAVIMGLSRECVNNAREPRYYEKTQLCAAVSEKCMWLSSANEENILRTDACLWPDGAAAIMKKGVLVPFKIGHKF
jgi:hypothetical protein